MRPLARCAGGKELMYAVEQSEWRPVGVRTARTVGLGTAVAGAQAARSGRIPASKPGPLARADARQSRRPRFRLDRGGGGRAVGLFRLLPRRARRARRGAPLRQVRARGAARAELSPALPDRDGA